MKKLTLSAIVLSVLLPLHFVKAEDTVIGEPKKGTPVTTITDGKDKVEITTTGITVHEGKKGSLKAKFDSDGDADDTYDAADAGASRYLSRGGFGKTLRDILVPFAFFAFLLAVILGGRYFNSRNEQRRLDVLRLMVEKGQPIPENVMSQILTAQSAPEEDTARQTYKRTRNAYMFTIAGLLLMGYALVAHHMSEDVLIPGLVFLCIGAGGMAGLYLPKRDQKISG